jgi:PAS domain S-box-containing protein
MTGVQPGWSAFTGQTEAEYEGFGWANAVHPEDGPPTVAAWNDAVASRSMFVFEHRVRRHDGVYRRFAIRAVPLLDPDGTIREWVGSHTDVTEQRELLESRARAGRGRAVARRVRGRPRADTGSHRHARRTDAHRPNREPRLLPAHWPASGHWPSLP